MIPIVWIGGRNQYFTAETATTVAKMVGPRPQHQAANAMAGKTAAYGKASPKTEARTWATARETTVTDTATT